MIEGFLLGVIATCFDHRRHLLPEILAEDRRLVFSRVRRFLLHRGTEPMRSAVARKAERRESLGIRGASAVVPADSGGDSAEELRPPVSHSSMSHSSRLVKGICGSLIGSNGAGKVGSRSQRTRCRWGGGSFVASCLSKQFGLPGKRYALWGVTLDEPQESRFSSTAVCRTGSSDSAGIQPFTMQILVYFGKNGRGAAIFSFSVYSVSDSPVIMRLRRSISLRKSWSR